MGVRGLKSFFEREGQTRPIDIGNEVDKWMRKNPGQNPLIVIDFLSIVNTVVKKEGDSICGGRHQIAMKNWKQLLNAIKATKCSLVFFSDLNIQQGKIEEWLKRRNDDFDFYTELYDSIERKTLSEIINECKENKALSSTFYGMAVIAQSYGEFNFSIKYECDLEVAQYAKRHNALAVISNDTDFLIFDGRWRFWSAPDIRIVGNRLKTTEFNRYGLSNILGLSQYQLPLFATLLANDFTSQYYNELSRFCQKLGPLKYRIKNIARFIREMGRIQYTDEVIEQITSQVFGYVNDEIQQVIKNSLHSYDTNFPPATVDDPIESKLLHTSMYRPLMGNKPSIHGITLPFYDMRGCPEGTNLSTLLINWVKRRKGLLFNPGHSFILLAKKNIHEKFFATTETVITPDFQIPPANELYGSYFGVSPCDEISEIQWKIFGWVTTISEDVVTAIRQLPDDFRLISTTLYILVQNGLMDIKAADGILHTEKKIYDNECEDHYNNYPNLVVTQFIRAAHMYNIVFSSMRQNFAMAGLLPCIQEVLQFDGVYFQNLMRSVVTLNDEEYENFISYISEYRIYANCYKSP